MKKVLFCLSLIFGLLVLNQVPSFAMDFTIDLPTIGGLGDLGYGLIGGASFDFNGSEWTIDNYDNLSEQLKAEAAEQKAREFLQAYCMARGIPIPNITPDLPATTGKEFYKSMYFDSANRSVWNNYKLGRTTIEQQDALRFPISPQSFADWSQYSAFWYQKYAASFADASDVITPDPDPNYLPAIDHINGSGFFFKEWTSRTCYNTGGYPTQNFPYSAYSYVNTNANGLSNNLFNDYFEGGQSPIFDVLIHSADETSYYYNCTATMLVTTKYYGDNVTGLNFRKNNQGVEQWIGVAGSSTGTYNYTSGNFNSLSALFDNLKSKFKNVNIYVNGALWSLAYNPNAPADPFIPDFNDVIGGNDEDPVPAYDIVLPDTANYDGTFDITSIFDAIKEAIIGASDSDATTDSTLTKDKVSDTFRTKTGEAVQETDVPIDVVLDDSFPVQGTLNYPNLPPLPIMPLDNAFIGTTILSELIDACQQILPEPLALAFWGMIFILFIIGLIRILHK